SVARAARGARRAGASLHVAQRRSHGPARRAAGARGRADLAPAAARRSATRAARVRGSARPRAGPRRGGRDRRGQDFLRGALARYAAARGVEVWKAGALVIDVDALLATPLKHAWTHAK